MGKTKQDEQRLLKTRVSRDLHGQIRVAAALQESTIGEFVANAVGREARRVVQKFKAQEPGKS